MSTENMLLPQQQRSQVTTLRHVRSFPFEYRLRDGRVVIIDRFNGEHFSQALKLIQKAARASKGFAWMEVEDAAAFRFNFLNPADGAMVATDISRQRLVAFHCYGPSDFCRSTYPVNCLSNVVVDKEFSSCGLGTAMMTIGDQTALEIDGYLGNLNSTIFGNAAQFHAIERIGYKLQGRIPKGVRTIDGKWTDDVISYWDFEKYTLTINRKALPTSKQLERYKTVAKFEEDLLNPRKIPLDHRDLPSLSTTFHFPKKVLPGDLAIQGRSCRIQPATTSEELLYFEELVRQEALSGGAFAMDEFEPHHGFFNRRCFRTSCVLQATCNATAEAIGSAIIGQSAICRPGTPSPFMACYVIVDQSRRRRGYGRDVLSLCETLGQHVGFEGILTDCFKTNEAGIAFLENACEAYQVVGMFPKCAYIRNRGFTTSVLYFKEFGSMGRIAKL